MVKLNMLSRNFAHLNLKDFNPLPNNFLSLNDSNDVKYIFLTRKKSKCIDSMRRHYGKWLFTETYLDDTDICSNYFNFKIKYQDFDTYYQIYNDAISYALTGKSYITITYEDILNKNLTALEEFIKHKVNGDLIQ